MLGLIKFNFCLFVACFFVTAVHGDESLGDVLLTLSQGNFVDGSYLQPPYFERLEVSYMDPFFAAAENTRHRGCVRRPLPPAEGQGCAKLPKTCFFGTQVRTCAAGLAGTHPVTKCECTGGTRTSFGTWSCSEVAEVCAETVTPESLSSTFRGMPCEEIVRPGILDIYPSMEVVCCVDDCSITTDNDHIIAFVVDGVVDSFEVMLSPFV